MNLWKMGLGGVAAALLALTSVAQAETRIQGAGATFPQPLYMKWIETYNAAHPEVKVGYSGGGSGAGIKAITDRTVQFAGSDGPMTADQEKKTPGKVLHLPAVAGPEVMIYNLPEVKEQIKLDGATVAEIYLMKIKSWNDPKIAKLNPGVALPGKPVVVVHRSDGSGTTFIFTNYLAKVSKEWAENVGNATTVEWPAGQQGGPGNKGVAAAVKNTVGAIGYVEYAYAKSENLTYAKQINKDGKEVVASIEGVVAATSASLQSFPGDLKVSITDASGAESYPICGFTYILVYEDLSYLKDKDAAMKLVNFIQWCMTEGQETAKDLGYAKLPKEAQEKVLAKLKTIKFDGEALLK